MQNKTNTQSKFKPLIVVSGLYLLLMIVLSVGDLSEFKEMKPNEWGDFLAGTFAPLAFMWLVFGYRQQGEELKQNTEALKLQAEELKNSVEQQKQLVKVTQVELELIKNKDDRQIKLETINAQPFFHFYEMKIAPLLQNPDGTTMGLLEFSFSLKNSRGVCREISITNANYNRSLILTTQFDLLDNETSAEKIKLYLPFEFEYKNGESFTVDLEINYHDAYDIKQFQIIELSVERDYSSEELAFKMHTKRKGQSF
ncbi:hypothetical protein ACG94V_17980 [Acinetobacter sp. ULE_I001]|uniref:hypothetical protein n=1 Tax=unclassified Acinetobacter TaxID=196816 RepID=UPI003AF8FBA8